MTYQLQLHKLDHSELHHFLLDWMNQHVKLMDQKISSFTKGKEKAIQYALNNLHANTNEKDDNE